MWQVGDLNNWLVLKGMLSGVRGHFCDTKAAPTSEERVVQPYKCMPSEQHAKSEGHSLREQTKANPGTCLLSGFCFGFFLSCVQMNSVVGTKAHTMYSLVAEYAM